MEKIPLAWLVSADMGYGHQRAIYPLRHWGKGGILNAADNPRITKEEKAVWRKTLKLYEFFSRAGRLPYIGTLLSRVLDRVLYIPQLYPMQDLSHSTYQVRFLKKSIQNGLCRGVLTQIAQEPLPMVTSFYAPAIAADMYGGIKVYCIICDADLNRVWVAEDPWESHITYLVPTGRVAQRLQSYGVAPERIHITGFPLPLELLGGESLDVLRRNLSVRLQVLDPNRRFQALHHKSVEHFLGAPAQVPSGRIFTVTFAIGGAGAQKEIGGKLLASLREKILSGEMRINLGAGTRPEIRDYFQRIIDRDFAGCPYLFIIYGETNAQYFDTFNRAIGATDVLWTKPSELSFYCGLGLPVILTPVIGPQEWFNKKWLSEIGAGFKQYSPEYAHQWLIDLLNKGRLAEMAWDGFLKARKCGTFKIQQLLETGSFTASSDPLNR